VRQPQSRRVTLFPGQDHVQADQRADLVENLRSRLARQRLHLCLDLRRLSINHDGVSAGGGEQVIYRVAGGEEVVQTRLAAARAARQQADEHLSTASLQERT